MSTFGVLYVYVCVCVKVLGCVECVGKSWGITCVHLSLWEHHSNCGHLIAWYSKGCFLLSGRGGTWMKFCSQEVTHFGLHTSQRMKLYRHICFPTTEGYRLHIPQPALASWALSLRLAPERFERQWIRQGPSCLLIHFVVSGILQHWE